MTGGPQQQIEFAAAEAEAASEAARLRRALAEAAPARWRGLLALLVHLGLRQIEDGGAAAVETAEHAAELAEALGVSERTCRRYVADLSELGLLNVTRPAADGAREPNRYRLTAAAVAAAANSPRIDAARRRGAGGRTCPPVDRPLSARCPPVVRPPEGFKNGGGGGRFSCFQEQEKKILLPPPSAQGCPPADRPAGEWDAPGRERVGAWLADVAGIGDWRTALAGAERAWPAGPEAALAELESRWRLLREAAAAGQVRTPSGALAYWLREGRCPVAGLAEAVERARREAADAAAKERARAAEWIVGERLRRLREDGVPHAERDDRLRAELTEELGSRRAAELLAAAGRPAAEPSGVHR